MRKLDAEARRIAKGKLTDELQEAIGRVPKGLTGADLDECWKLAKDYWGIKPANKRCPACQLPVGLCVCVRVE